MLWLWRRPAATAPIRPLAWEPPYAAGVAQEMAKRQKKKKKMWYIYTMQYYTVITKKKVMPFAATWMELENLTLSEMSQKDKDKYHMLSLICGI